METIEESAEIAAQMQYWQEVAETVVRGKLDIEDCIEANTQDLKRQEADGVISVDDLRAGVAFANTLDKDAVEQYGADLSEGAERVERTAWRIMHHAGRTALKEINQAKQHQTRSNISRNARLHAKRGRYSRLGRQGV